eukprot:4777720-Amphidinium_carterae.1
MPRTMTVPSLGGKDRVLAVSIATPGCDSASGCPALPNCAAACVCAGKIALCSSNELSPASQSDPPQRPKTRRHWTQQLTNQGQP